jgi:hypothetical protein
MALLRFLLCAAACLGLLAANAHGYDHDWGIEPIGDIIVQAVEDDIVFRYNVPALREGKECSVRLFNEDCITDGGSSVYLDTVDTTSVERELTSNFRIDTETIKTSSYYTDMDAYRGRISFCTRVDCTLNGESYNFHETQLMVDFDWTVGFAINAELGSSSSRYKLLHAYKLSLYKTDGELGDDSLGVIKAAAGLFLEAELNYQFRDLNNPVTLTTTVLGQKMVTKQVEKGLRLLRGGRDVSRSLIEYETVTGSELGIGLEALFEREPAPHVDEVNAAQAVAWTEKATLFLGNLTSILSICGSVSLKFGLGSELKADLLLLLSHINAIFSLQELADISEADLEYAKSLYKEDYENGQLTNTSLVNTTLAAGLANLTYDELVFTEAAVGACGGNLTEIGNITEILVPERQDGTSSQFLATVSFGHPIDAFFCDASNNQVSDPVLSQGDTIRVCVRLSKNSSYFHLEDIYMMALTQPTTGVMTHYAVYDGNASALATKNCQLGMCNILTQVPSRFFDQAFDQDSGPVRIVGVALLNVGPADRRILAPIDFSGHRQLQTSDEPRSAFELSAEILGSFDVDLDLDPTSDSKTNTDIYKVCILLLVTISTVAVGLVFSRRRKPKAARTPSEPLPMQPTPSMKMQEPLRTFARDTYPYPDNRSNPSTVARTA